MIDLFFTLFNFGLIIGLIVYSAYRYIVPQLKNKVDEQSQAEQNLHDEHRNLLLTQKQVDESIVAQESECTTYFNKINQWRGAVSHQKAQKEDESKRLKEEAEKRLHLQSHYHMLRTMQREINPFVVKLLEADLKNHFLQEERTHAYMHHVLKNLKK